MKRLFLIVSASLLSAISLWYILLGNPPLGFSVNYVIINTALQVFGVVWVLDKLWGEEDR